MIFHLCMVAALVCLDTVKGEDDNLILRIRNQISVDMSSTWDDFYALNAVDGNENTDAEKCHCCAGAASGPAWWRLNLGNVYKIATIILIGRNDANSGQSRQLSFHKGFSNSSHQDFLHKITETSGYQFTITLDTPTELQYLEVSKPVVLSICELKLVEYECPDGQFGNSCVDCGNCKDTSTCDKSTGACPYGCLSGYRGSFCNDTCDNRTFGQNCSSICHCLNNAVCNHINGSCPNDLCAPGWQAMNCNTECDGGTFGQNCQNDCHCQDRELCEKVHGSCPSGLCAKGWKGSSCNTKCDDGTFGQNCLSVCHCLNNKTCHHEAGTCPNDICAPGWKGSDCSTECNDGRFGQNCGTECHCLDNVACNKASGICLSGLCANGWRGIQCNTECYRGTFGVNCSSICHCQNNATCDHKDGTCPYNVCAPGWKGSNCNTECDDGTFGQDCQSNCHCLDQVACDKISGICSSGKCANGWIGNNCSTECYDGTFGQNCISVCHCRNNSTCNHVDGKCPDNVCAPGWKETACNTECDDGTFGQNCESACHCRDPEVCNKINGRCLSGLCENGWKGDSCSTRCPGGSFGQNCSSVCHCVENVTCDHITGVCLDGSCAPGWTGIDCNTVSEALEEPEGPPTGPIVGAVVGVLVLLIVVIVVILYRKRNSQQKSKPNQDSFTELEENKESDKAVPKKSSQRKQQRKQNNDKDAVDVATDHTYYAFDSQAKNIPVNEIWDYVNLAYTNKCEKLHQEFQKLPAGLVHDCNEARRPENAKKTRYKQMFAYDHSRVILKRDDPNVSTYVNASYVDGYRKTKKFIASQGPTESMVGDFWEMVIQENTSIIIMLTNVVENAMMKCLQYWPISENEELTFGDVTILTSKINTFPDYTIRELDISKEGKALKRVTQFHFTAWPDKDVPDAAWHLVNFWRKVDSVVQTIKEPVVVHCSAGVGRTGTFIGLDNLHAQAKAEGYIQPFDMITRLRHQRVNMVQTKFQYVFLHEAVAEALYIGVKPIKANEFDAVYKLLLESDKTTGITGLEQQHRLIKEKPTISDETNEYCNVSPTQEYDAYRPNSMTSSSSGKGDGHGMCYVHNYAGKDTFIVMKTSIVDTVETLWKTIEKHNIKTVITLHDETDRAEAMLDKQNAEGNVNEYNQGAVQLIETTREKYFIEKTFTGKQQKSGKESRNTKEFIFLTAKGKPTITASVISFLNAIQRWQPSVVESQPILITHENAFKRCGLICLLLCEFERVRTKDSVNILATVKHLKEKNLRLIPDYEQYKLCYSAVLEYIRQSDVYMNV